ncbi:hypothetical protein JTB14_025325 [Gonioctena quinquepunctata]|nr:hypothetical protein JTB14_025325 [Gonioctena quinquepunctata]
MESSCEICKYSIEVEKVSTWGIFTNQQFSKTLLNPQVLKGEDLVLPKEEVQVRTTSADEVLRRKQYDTSKSFLPTERSTSVKIPRRSIRATNVDFSTNLIKIRIVRTPVSSDNVGKAFISKLTTNTVLEIQREHMGKIAIETSAPQIT